MYKVLLFANNKNMKENIKIKNGFQGERSLVMPEMILDLAESDPVLQTLYITDIGYYPHATYHYRERTEPIDQCVLIYCEKASHKGIIIGKNGAMLKKISTEARQDIERFMGTKVYLETWVKVKENWRDNMNYIRSFGYNDQ